MFGEDLHPQLARVVSAGLYISMGNINVHCGSTSIGLCAGSPSTGAAVAGVGRARAEATGEEQAICISKRRKQSSVLTNDNNVRMKKTQSKCTYSSRAVARPSGAAAAFRVVRGLLRCRGNQAVVRKSQHYLQ